MKLLLIPAVLHSPVVSSSACALVHAAWAYCHKKCYGVIVNKADDNNNCIPVMDISVGWEGSI